MRKALLSPKDLADAIGASESSLRRWIDSGRLKMARTAGGHRRIELAEAVRFIRRSKVPLVRPELLGLDAVSLRSTAAQEDSLYDALAAGDRTLARSLVRSWFTAGRSLAEIYDGPIRAAMHRLGELWKRDPAGILVEHRATVICIGILHQLRALLPEPPAGGGLALGAAPGDEWHAIPTLMASTIVMEAGLRDVNYGAATPIELLAAAADEHKAALVWLSFTMPPPRTMRTRVDKLATQLRTSDTTLVIGGQFSAAALPRTNPNVHRFDSMAELAAFLDAMPNARPRK